MTPTTPATPSPACKCTRCRHQHTEADRVYVPDRRTPGIRNSTCPKCGGRSYTRS